MKTNLISEKEVLSQNSQVIRLSGELDISSAPDFKEDVLSLLGQGYNHLIVDLNELNFMDSRGLGSFIGILRTVNEQGGSLKIICSKQAILKIFRRTGLDEVFMIYNSLEDAGKS